MPDFIVTIAINDVAKGDIRDLVTEILEKHEEDFDAARGDFAIRVSQRVGETIIPIELEDE